VASGITINSNLAAINAERRLGQNTKELERSFTRLASGLRINRAADDAAGLAISQSLNIDSRVFTQGIRNLNDGISLTNIAESTLTSLTDITIRQRELATQAGNGTLSSKQRLALNQEANALVDEFNRIVTNTEFNGQKLLNLSVASFLIQGSYGTNGGLSFGLGDELAENRGTDTLQTAVDNSTGFQPWGITAADFNGDGKLDIVSSNYGPSTLNIFLGQGDGTFDNSAEIWAGSVNWGITSGDLNLDGKADLVVADFYNGANVFLGNGNGTFADCIGNGTPSRPYACTVGDVNHDGKPDIVTGDYQNEVTVILGAGNGSGASTASFKTRAGNQYSVALGDLNNDNNLDIVTSGTTTVLLGNGDGTFNSQTNWTSGTSSYALALGDVNSDGILDMVSGSAANATVFIGNGNGTFNAKITYAAGAAVTSIALGDMNGDSTLDLVSASNNAVSLLLGNTDGTFSAAKSFVSGSSMPKTVLLGDLNQDNVLDVAASGYTTDNISTLVQNSQAQTTIPYLNLTTQYAAKQAMKTIDATLTRISAEHGVIGSIQSRLTVELNILGVSRDNYLNAKSQITDADVAQETAELVKNQIRQQAAAGVLAQANQAPQLALSLLKEA
jgi:flagellin-like hook-associated protein FlgL